MDCEGPGPERDGEHEVAAHDCESAVEASAVLVGGLGLGLGFVTFDVFCVFKGIIWALGDLEVWL